MASVQPRPARRLHRRKKVMLATALVAIAVACYASFASFRDASATIPDVPLERRAMHHAERERHRRGVRSNDGEWAIEDLDRAGTTGTRARRDDEARSTRANDRDGNGERMMIERERNDAKGGRARSTARAAGGGGAG